jgi:hypothetical protein
VIKKEAEKILKYKRPLNSNTAHVERKNRSDTSNDRSNWNYLKIIQNKPAQHTGKGGNEVTRETAILGTAHILRKVIRKSTKHSAWEIAVHVPSSSSSYTGTTTS